MHLKKLIHGFAAAAIALCATLNTASAADTYKLALNQSSALGKDGHRVTFMFARDSRCPAGAQCIVAGSAYALLWLEKGKKSSLVGVTSPNPRIPLEVSNKADGYEFCYVSLEPAPDTKRVVQPRDHVLTFTVEQVGSDASKCATGSSSAR